MVETKIEDLELTVNALRVDGKKFTKSLFTQLEHRSIIEAVFLYPYAHGQSFEMTVPDLVETDARIIARHYFQVDSEDRRLHFLWSFKSELFHDSLDTDYNPITQEIENRRNDVDYYQEKVAIAQRFLSKRDFTWECWHKIIEPARLGGAISLGDEFSCPLTEAGHIAVDAMFSSLNEESDEVLGWSHTYHTSIPAQHFKDFLSDKSGIVKTLESEMQRCSTEIINKVPNIIARDKALLEALEGGYDQFIGRLKAAPKIIIGV